MSNVYLMLGASGSGKSTTAEKISQQVNARVCSADHLFSWLGDGTYMWNPNCLHEAHTICFCSFSAAIKSGLDVVVDNTNTRVTDIVKYVRNALTCNAKVFIVEPESEWKYDADALFNKSTHNVPMETIHRMLSGIETVKKFLIANYKLEDVLINNSIPARKII